MGKIVKIFEDEKEKYTGNCYVNTVIFRGRIPQSPKLYGNDTVKFSVQLSGGKDKKTGQWRNPTYANIVAFGDLGQKILKRLEIELDKSKEYASTKLIQIKTGKKYDWKDLKKYYIILGLEIKKTQDANYGEVNSYPAQAWKEVYKIKIKEII